MGVRVWGLGTSSQQLRIKWKLLEHEMEMVMTSGLYGLGFPRIRATPVGCTCSMDCSILVFTLEFPIYGNYLVNWALRGL